MLRGVSGILLRSVCVRYVIACVAASTDESFGRGVMYRKKSVLSETLYADILGM